MLCGIVSSKNFDQALSTVLKGNREADLLEFRLDQMAGLTFDQIKTLRESSEIPIIFTLRAHRQGGEYPGTEWDRLEEIRLLATLNPAYIDLEYDVDADFFEKLHQTHPKVQLICSYHDFDKTPEDLHAIFLSLQKPHVSVFKIATFAHNACDSLRMLLFTREVATEGHPIIGICMGEDGSPTRILAPIFGGWCSYAFFEEASASGQIPLFVLASRFRYRFLTPSTAIYGVIGDPVSGSKGEMTHNAVFHQLNLDAVYTRFRVPENQLHDFMQLAEQADIAGLSVTMPLKEAVVAHLTQESPDQRVGALNTLSFEGHQVRGINTDGLGALNSIEKHGLVKGKKVAILGAGGAARAIAFEAKKRGAHIAIFNRHLERAQELAKAVGGEAFYLADFGKSYDILINCTSVGMPSNPGSPIPIDKILPETIVLDCIHTAATTPLTEAAKAKRCYVILGIEMYVTQAAEQSAYWVQADRHQAAHIIECAL